MKNEIVKVALATALCLGLLGAAFVGLNNITLAAATEGTQAIRLALPAVSTPAANAASEVTGVNQKPDMELNVIFESDTMPGINAMSPEAAAEIGAHYIWEMFGESIDGKTVQMAYSSSHPAFIRTSWHGTVLEPGTCIILPDSSIEERARFHRSTLFSFTIDSVTGEWIGISTTSHWVETPQEAMAALDELLNRNPGIATEEAVAIRGGGEPPAQLDGYIEAARGHAGRHFAATYVASVEFANINALAFELDENGNLFATERQLIFEVTDSTGRVADMAIAESTRQLIWLNTGMNDIVPGWNYVGTEPGIG